MLTTAIAHPGYRQPVRAGATVRQAHVQWPVRWAFYAFIFSLPFGVLSLPGLPQMVSASRALGAILLVSVIMAGRLRAWKTPKTLLCFAVFVLLYTLGSFFHNGFEDLPRVLRLIQLLILFSISYNLFLTGKVNRGALLTFVLSCGLAAALTLLGITTIAERVEATAGRIAGLGMDENRFAFYLVLGIIFCVGITYSRKEARPMPFVVAWPILILLFMGVAGTGSRGATVALIAGVATLVLKYGSLWTKVRNVLLITVLSLAAFALFSRSELFVGRISLAWEKGLSQSDRVVIARRSWEMATEKPVFGWGPVVSMQVLADREGRRIPGLSTHNTFLALLLDVGIVGILPFYLAVFACWLSAWRGRRGVEDILPFAVCMATLAIQLSLAHFWSMEYWLFLGYALAAGQLAARRVPSMARRRLASLPLSRFSRTIEASSIRAETSACCTRRIPGVRTRP